VIQQKHKTVRKVERRAMALIDVAICGSELLGYKNLEAFYTLRAPHPPSGSQVASHGCTYSGDVYTFTRFAATRSAARRQITSPSYAAAESSWSMETI